MSIQNGGIPINLGLTYGVNADGTWSLLANICPEVISLQYASPIEFPDVPTLGEFTLANGNDLYSGYSVLVNDTDITTRGLQTCEYMWNKYRWAKIGCPVVKEYVNIYNMTPVQESSNQNWHADFFMRLHTRAIKSNVSLLSLLDRRVMLRATDFITYCGISGTYSFDISTDNVLYRLLLLNIKGGINFLMQKICKDYQVDSVVFTDLQNNIFSAIKNILLETSFNFLEMCKEYTTLDFSMYINYIGACFSALKMIFIDIFNNRTVSNKVQPMNSLALIDQKFVNKLTSSTALANDMETMLDTIDNVIYSENSNTNTFYRTLNEVIEYFKTNNSKIFKYSSTRNAFLTKLCEGIGGVVVLALYLSLLSNGDELSKSTLFLQIINEQYWKDIK